METKSKAKQITLNVSESDKVRVNSLKEELKLTDKEIVSVLLDLVNTTDKDVVAKLVEKVQQEKAIESIKARLAKVTARAQELSAQLSAEETVETEVPVEA